MNLFKLNHFKAGIRKGGIFLWLGIQGFLVGCSSPVTENDGPIQDTGTVISLSDTLPIVESKEAEKQKNEYKGPDYSIITSRNLRYDNAPSYIVLLHSKVEMKDIKNNCELLVRDIVADKGRKCSVDVFADETAMDFVLSTHYFDGTLGRTVTKSEFKKYAKRYVASFLGQLETGSSPNTLLLLPFAEGCDCKAIDYFENYEFNP